MQQAQHILEENHYVNEVDADRKAAIKDGIRSVPVFVIDEKYMITGIQPIELFLQTFEKAQEAL